jgi:hypothetical protein
LDEQGQAITDDSFYVIFNAHHEPLQYILPAKQYGSKWEVVLDAGNPKNQKLAYGPGDPIPVEGRTVVVLKTASLLCKSVGTKGKPCSHPVGRQQCKPGKGKLWVLDGRDRSALFGQQVLVCTGRQKATS